LPTFSEALVKTPLISLSKEVLSMGFLKHSRKGRRVEQYGTLLILPTLLKKDEEDFNKKAHRVVFL